MSPNSAKKEVMSFSVLKKKKSLNFQLIKKKKTNFLGFDQQTI